MTALWSGGPKDMGKSGKRYQMSSLIYPIIDLKNVQISVIWKLKDRDEAKFNFLIFFQ